MSDEMETIKWRLSEALRDVNTLPTWEALVSKARKVTTTAAFFARYCFIRALAEDPTFDLHVHFEKPIFFTEAMKTFVDKPRRKCLTNDTRIVRETIDRYLPNFQNHYQYEKQKIPGLQSNLFQYEGCSLRTNYLNNIQTRLTTHLHKTINCMLHVVNIDDNYAIVKPLRFSSQISDIFCEMYPTSSTILWIKYRITKLLWGMMKKSARLYWSYEIWALNSSKFFVLLQMF